MCQGVAPAVTEEEGLAPAGCEEELTRQVPLLLDAMNQASSEVNALERRICEAQLRYKRRLGHWSRLYKELRCLYGSSFDHIKLYFDRAQAALECVQGVSHEFSMAQQEASGNLPEELDRLERRCAAAVAEHRKALQALEACRRQVGGAAVRRTLPCFRLLRQHQQKLVAEQSRIHELRGQTGAAKNQYGRSLRELERISAAVHAVRKEA